MTAALRLPPAPTPGPWQWFRRLDGVYLGTPDRGHLIVMDFVRLGFQGAQPRFALWEGETRERLGGLMKPARDFEMVSAHPDARLIAAAPALLSALSNLVKVIAVDQLLPESVSYMREARAALELASGRAPEEQGQRESQKADP